MEAVMFDAKGLAEKTTNQEVNELLLAQIRESSFTTTAEWIIQNFKTAGMQRLFEHLKACPKTMATAWQALAEQKSREPLFLDAEPLQKTSSPIHPFILLLAQYARVRYRTEEGQSEAFGTKAILEWLTLAREQLEKVSDEGTRENNLSMIAEAKDQLENALRVWQVEGTKGKLLKESLDVTAALLTLTRLASSIKLALYVKLVLEKLDKTIDFYTVRKKNLLALGSMGNQYMIEEAALEEKAQLQQLWREEKPYAVSQLLPLLLLMKNHLQLGCTEKILAFLAMTFFDMGILSNSTLLKAKEQKKIAMHFFNRTCLFATSSKQLLQPDSDVSQYCDEMMDYVKETLPKEEVALPKKAIGAVDPETCSKLLEETDKLIKKFI